MTQSLDFSIREQLASYLANEISLSEFEDWFFSETWDIDQTNNLALINLVYGIKLRLAEFSKQDLTESELRSHLRPFIERFTETPSQYQIQYGTSSINVEVPMQVAWPVDQCIGIRLSTVFV
jgi:hypothetical protein